MKESLIENFISQKRFKSYNNLAQYTKNLLFSRDSYIPLSILEIALKNSIDIFLSKKVSVSWYDNNTNFLTKDSIKKVNQAKLLLQRRREPIIREKIIAELTFGFWVNLLKKPYDKKLRIKDMKLIFPNLPSKQQKFINREILFKKLNHIRNFRNRVFHYEKVLDKDSYNNIFDEIYEIINYFDKELCSYTKNIIKKEHYNAIF